jgi:hypothetical protein
MKTLDDEVTRTWYLVNISRYSGPVVAGQRIESVPVELWKIDMLREGRDWKLCGFTETGPGVTTAPPRRGTTAPG